MIKLYYYPAPNPAKVALFLEEAGLAYEVEPVDIRKGEQHKAAFLSLNPNAKVPVLIDGDTVVFDSNAILLYLAEKTGRFSGPAQQRGQLLSWLMFVASGVGPYSGQAVHFKHYAPEPIAYAVNRYTFEAERHWRILDAQLAKTPYMLGDSYTIVDMAVWGWARAMPFILGSDAWAAHPNVKRLIDAIDARPAAIRAGEIAGRYTFKTEINDEEARTNMFPHTKR